MPIATLRTPDALVILVEKYGASYEAEFMNYFVTSMVNLALLNIINGSNITTDEDINNIIYNIELITTQAVYLDMFNTISEVVKDLTKSLQDYNLIFNAEYSVSRVSDYSIILEIIDNKESK
jgi:hypothetical protein